MRLFEQFGASEFVLKAANAALSVAEENDQSLVRVTFCIIHRYGSMYISQIWKSGNITKNEKT